MHRRYVCQGLFPVCQRYKVWKQFTTDSYLKKECLMLFPVCQRYKVWKQFTTYEHLQQSFEWLFPVCQRYKVWKQFTTVCWGHSMNLCCFQSVKDIKFESNSQPCLIRSSQEDSCFQSVKDIKFESNSQPSGTLAFFVMAVSSLSKI